MEQPVLQSSLGAVTNNSNSLDRTWNNGTLAMCKVLKVHHKRYTADVIIMGTSNVIRSSNDNEGKHSCRIGVGNAGFDKTFQKAYGQVVPVQEGSIVLVAFMNNKREKPVILRVLHDIGEEVGESNDENILSTVFTNTTKLSEIDTRRYINILRTQDFVTIDGLGNFEVSSHTKAFLVGKYTEEIDPENYGYEELSIKDKNKNTVSLPASESKPMKMVAAFQDSYDSGSCNWIRFIVEAAKTIFKVAKQQRSDNKLSMFEIQEDGAIRLRRQQDSVVFDDGTDFTDVIIKDDGEIYIERMQENNRGSRKTTISIKPDDITLKKKSEKVETLMKITEDEISVKRQSEKLSTLKITDAEVSVKTDVPIKYESEESIELKVQNSSLKLLPAGVKLTGTKIDLN